MANLASAPSLAKFSAARLRTRGSLFLRNRICEISASCTNFMRPGPSRDGSRGPGRAIKYWKSNFAASGISELIQVENNWSHRRIIKPPLQRAKSCYNCLGRRKLRLGRLSMKQIEAIYQGGVF